MHRLCRRLLSRFQRDASFRGFAVRYSRSSTPRPLARRDKSIDGSPHLRLPRRGAGKRPRINAPGPLGMSCGLLMRHLPWFFLALVAVGCRSVGQSPVRNNAPDIRRIHPAPATHLIRFQELDEGIYKGSKPKTEADYDFLQSKGVKYILELRLFPWLNVGEKRKARKHGMTLLTGTISASTKEPSKKHVDAILCLLRDKRY